MSPVSSQLLKHVQTVNKAWTKHPISAVGKCCWDGSRQPTPTSRECRDAIDGPSHNADTSRGWKSSRAHFARLRSHTFPNRKHRGPFTQQHLLTLRVTEASVPRMSPAKLPFELLGLDASIPKVLCEWVPTAYVLGGAATKHRRTRHAIRPNFEHCNIIRPQQSSSRDAKQPRVMEAFKFSAEENKSAIILILKHNSWNRNSTSSTRNLSRALDNESAKCLSQMRGAARPKRLPFGQTRSPVLCTGKLKIKGR